MPCMTRYRKPKSATDPQGTNRSEDKGNQLASLPLSRAFLKKEDVGPPLIAGGTAAICGAVLLLAA